MRSVLLSIFTILLLTSVAYGQPGYIGLYTDTDYLDCTMVDVPPGGVYHVYVVHKATLGAKGCGFMIDAVGTNISYFSFTTGYLTIGDPTTGIYVSYGGDCLSSDVLVMTVNYMGNGTSGTCSYLDVVPHPNQLEGIIESVNCQDDVVSAGGRRLFVNTNATCPCNPPGPWITGIEDVGNDQGRQARVSWASSPFDAPGDGIDITDYALYRRQDSNAASVSAEIPENIYRTEGEAPLLTGWDYVGSHPARGDAFYQLVLPTLCDSTATGGICWSRFFVSALTPDPLVFYDSEPDSGYTVDNLAPGVPGGFAVAYNTGAGNYLNWLESEDADFQFFKIYRGPSPDFTPGPSYLVHSTIDTDWHDSDFDGWDVHYKVSALDFNGNESDATGPDAATGVGGTTVPTQYALYQNSPNPFNPTTAIPYDVPEGAGRATLRVYDVGGRLVRTLADGVESPGHRFARWNGLDDNGKPAASGVYFYRLEAPDFQMTRKMLLLR